MVDSTTPLGRLVKLIRHRVGTRWRGQMVKPRFQKRVKDESGFYAVGKGSNEYSPRLVLVSHGVAFHYTVKDRSYHIVDLKTNDLINPRLVPDEAWEALIAEVNRLCDQEIERRQRKLAARDKPA